MMWLMCGHPLPARMTCTSKCQVNAAGHPSSMLNKMLGSSVEVSVVAVFLPAPVRFHFLGWLRRVRGLWYPAVTGAHPAASGRCWTHRSAGCTRLPSKPCRSRQSPQLLHSASVLLTQTSKSHRTHGTWLGRCPLHFWDISVIGKSKDCWFWTFTCPL